LKVSSSPEWSKRFIEWCAARPSLSIHLVAGGMHAGAGVLVLIYNAILQRGFPAAPAAPLILKASRYYFLFAISLAGLLRHYSVKNRVLSYLEAPSEERLEKLHRFPLYQALNSLLCWLLAVPVMALVAIKVNGAVHPVRFPHFCLSVLFAGLLTSVYSTTFHTLLACTLSKSHAGNRTSVPLGLSFAARVTPWIAFVIPVLVYAVYVSFEKPPGMDPESYLRLGKFFLLLMALSGYAWVFCDFTSRGIRGALAGGPVLKRSLRTGDRLD
jgi:hypothetical protein